MLSSLGAQYMRHVQGDWPITNLSHNDVMFVLTLTVWGLAILGFAALTQSHQTANQ